MGSGHVSDPSVVMFALVDCNNFYASCQRLFRPDLKDQPIVILSNNDGCIVSRSSEAKALGIPMATPEFKVRQFLKDNQVNVFSSNYALYGDLSNRIMNTLRYLNPVLEVYSIDEAFLDVTSFQGIGYQQHANTIKSTVEQWTGIPVSIGVAPTKTLAKLANHVAKKSQKANGIFLIDDSKPIDSILKKVRVGDVWGVGRRLNQQLNQWGIFTAYDLKCADQKWIKRNWSVVLQRTVKELNGESCLELEEITERKQILVSRSFKEKVTDYDKLNSLIAGYIARGAEKLRQQESLANGIAVYIRTSPHRDDYHNASKLINLPTPTADTSLLIKAASYALQEIHKPKARYSKAGIMLTGLTPEKNQQLNLFDSAIDGLKAKKRMKVMDQLNRKYGDQTVRIASESPERWFMNQNHLSPAYTTRWDQLPSVK